MVLKFQSLPHNYLKSLIQSDIRYHFFVKLYMEENLNQEFEKKVTTSVTWHQRFSETAMKELRHCDALGN